MSIINTYPIFEADQVLTNDHLNNVFNYLDQEDRLTRMKLIGSGIVCGLEILPGSSSSEIIISKGCALTSQGFMLLLCQKNYTHYTSYTPPVRPNDLQFIQQCDEKEANPLPFYDQQYNQGLLRLVEKEAVENEDGGDVIALSQMPADFLNRYAVVLFLEAEELSLKNCDTNDCNDKGSRIDFDIKALLVDKNILDKIIKINGDVIINNAVNEQPLLKRYNVPVQKITTASDVLIAFRDLADQQTLADIANALKKSVSRYQYLTGNENTAVFDTAYEALLALRDDILKNYPLLIQYFYDYLDDIIKAYYEFVRKAQFVHTECCMNEMKFPLHIMLGEANGATSGNRSAYRQYFIYSPLFNDQKNKLGEVQLLFTRLKLLLTQFSIDNMFPFEKRQVRITPSRYGKAPLSDRCIPYYYDVATTEQELYRCWSYKKTGSGEESRNLSYNASEYSSAFPVLNPLLYDIEPYNFFRIEGHIGKNINEAIAVVKQEQQDKNLPFEVVALSADYIGALVRGEEPKCIIQDLESDYRVLIAEFVCKLHDAYCKVGRTEYKPLSIFTGTVTLAANAVSARTATLPAALDTNRVSAITPEEEEEETKILKTSLVLNPEIVSHPFVSILVNEFHASKAYVKGDTISRLCKPAKDTIGAAYINIIQKNNGQFKNPVAVSTTILGTYLRNGFFELIDSIESMFILLMNNELADLNITAFKTAYERYETAIENVSVRLLRININPQIFLNTCITEQLEALKNEYLRRTAQYRLAKNFSYYFSRHGGVEHKAGVPKGGTFILVYHEERKRQLFDVRSILINKELRSILLRQFPGLLQSTQNVDELETKTEELHTAIQFKEPELYIRMNDVLGKYLEECKDLPEASRNALEAIIKLPPQRTAFTLTDGMVIADFYIPYICCSDCPPIAYIITPPPVQEDQTPVLRIAKDSFCNSDQTAFAITATPAGGTIEGEGVKRAADGTFVFVPAGLAAGSYVIKYTVGQKTASVTVQVTATPAATFTTTKKIGDGIIRVEIKNESSGTTDQSSYNWFLDDEPFSDKKDPDPLTFKLQTLPHTLRLRVSNSGCPSEFEEVISLETETRKLSVCSDVKEQSLESNIPDGASITIIKNDGGIMDGKLIIHPSAMNITQTTTFNVSYTINNKQKGVAITVIFANADFTMELTSSVGTNALIISLKLVSLDATISKSEWQLIQGNNVITKQEKDVLISPFVLGDFVDITHAVASASPQNCGKTKNFRITQEIFKLNLNKGPFKNV
ncbi:hypothetical protein DC498_00660 [Terrimonas sp.]|uniref:Ig-like domain-containing protein n=1 Tax=Terrimonas sp. TaxID=1914338 RepID=UPI000D50FBE1|nr:Ig-like domain-containing protein [Terrimonas sp.]PVD53941.1 hypothetical protein DC498_00660 [Terrimonas sp.]